MISEETALYLSALSSIVNRGKNKILFLDEGEKDWRTKKKKRNMISSFG
jgi:hypothetical protein